jgi:hypothetical protein
LVEGHVEVYTEPQGDSYAKARRYDRSQSIVPVHFPELEVRVADVLK